MSDPGATDLPVAQQPAAAQPTTAGLQSAAMHASWWTAIQALLGIPLAFVVNLVVARTLGPHGYGIVASYVAAYALILVVINTGVSDAAIQWGAAAYARGDRRELLDITRRCAGYHIFVEGPLGAVAALALLHRETLWVQFAGAVSVAVTMVVGTTTVMLTAVSRNAALAKIAIVIGVATQLAVVTAAVQTHAAGPTWVARLVIAALAPAAALALAPRDMLRAAFAPLLPRHWPPGFARYSNGLFVATLVSTLVFSRSEVLVLDVFGDAAAAGVFALAAGLAAQITAPVDAMLGPLVPAAASLVAVGRDRSVPAVLRGIRLSSLITLPVLVVIVPLLAVLVPAIYGSRFAAAGALFVGLAVTSCLQSVLHPATAFVTALRKPMLLLAVNGAALAVDVVLVFALVPWFGAWGAVVANIAAQLVALAALPWILRRHLGLGLRATESAMRPLAAVAVGVSAVCALAVTASHHGVGVAAAAAGAVVVSCLLAVITVRAAGGVVTDGDLSKAASGLPRGAGLLVTAAARLGLARSSELC